MVTAMMTAASETTVDQLLRERREFASRQFKARHPHRAAEEAALKRTNRKARKEFAHKQDGTPETHAKAALVQQGALARLFRSGTLSIDELAWAQEISVVAARIQRGLSVCTVSLETHVDGGMGPEAGFFESLGQVRAEIAYTRWRNALPRPGAILAMIVEDVGIEAAARKHGMSRRTAKKQLLDALNAWPEYYADACDQIDAADLAAAQAGLM